MYLLLYFIPVLNLFLCLRRFSVNVSICFNLLLLIILHLIIIDTEMLIELGNWVKLLELEIDWTFHIDKINKYILYPIVFISSLVHFYSLSYLGEDPHRIRFHFYLNLFTLQMILLVTGDNYFTLFLGWEFVGFVSYLLVNFWYTSIIANHASIKALIMNRIGDYGLTIGIILWYISLNSFNLQFYIPTTTLFYIGICLLFGAFAKSAQIGLHSWLTAAMAGPTPVSSLLHSATISKINLFNSNKSLNPQWVTGFTDAEGSFTITIRKGKRFGYVLTPFYSLCAANNKYNYDMLKKIQKFFNNEGNVSRGGDMLYYTIGSMKGSLLLANHFNKYPLKSE